MYPIVAPILVGQNGPDVQNLQDIMLFLIGKGDIINSMNYQIPALENERNIANFGNETTNWIQMFKGQYFLQSNMPDLVNTMVANKLNELNSQYLEFIMIHGEVTLSNTIPLQSAKVEIWFEAFGIVAAGTLNVDGKFALSVAGPSVQAIGPGAALNYKIYRNNILVKETVVPYDANMDVFITVEQADYDSDSINNIPPENNSSFIIFRGNVYDPEHAVLKGVTVNIYETGFRVRELLSTSKTNGSGYYEQKILVKNIGKYRVIDTERSSRSLRIEVVNNNAEMIGFAGGFAYNTGVISTDIIAGGDVDQQIYEEYVLCSFDELKAKVFLVTNDADMLSITDGTNNTENEIAYIAHATGRMESEVAAFVKSFVYASQMSIARPDMVYALLKSDTVEENPVLKLSTPMIQATIEAAVEEKLISEVSQNDMNYFINQAKTVQVAGTRALPINNEDFTLNEVLNAVFQNQNTDLVNFLQAYNNADTVTNEEFWNDYEQSAGSTLAKKAKMGLQLSAVVGFQPEMVSSLLTDAISNDGIYAFANWSESDWLGRIQSVSTSSQRLCVPNIIQNVAADDQQAKEEFAQTLKNTFQDLYPLTNICSKLQGPDAADLIPDQQARSSSVAFIQNNPEADLRMVRVYDINAQDYDLSGVTSLDKLIEGLEPFQRLLRLTGGAPEAVAAMKIAGLDSAEMMMDMPVEDFVSTYGAMLGGDTRAGMVYATAKLVNTVAANAVVNINAMANTGWGSVIAIQNYPETLVAQAAADPNLRVLFGNLDYCSCQECLSLYSPAAYLTDMINFLRVKVPSAYTELMRRRSDIQHIDLTCKNTNTTLPYIDLVNELMEAFIIDKIKGNYSPALVPAKSYQTRGTANELAAVPEHVEKISNNYVDNQNYKKVYDDVLSQQVYPYSLPFSMPVEQTKVYFRQLGVSRLELMTLFREYNTTPPATPAANKVSDFAIFAEAMGLTFEVAEIICNDTNTDTWLHYGIKAQNVTTANGVVDPQGGTTLLAGLWSTILSGRLDVLLQQATINYRELLQLLNTEFLNPLQSGGTRLIYVDVNSGSANPDTCNLSELKLVFTGSATPATFFGKLYRFIRLWRSAPYTIYDWDTLFRSLNITTLNNSGNSRNNQFQRLGRVIVACQKLEVHPLTIATWWNNFDMVQYTNFNSETLAKLPSRYDNVFRNRSVLNPPNPDFKDLSYILPGNLPAGSDLPTPFSSYISVIASCFQITEAELLSILDFHFFPAFQQYHAVNITSLSMFHSFAAMAKALKLSISDYLQLLELTSPIDSTYFSSTAAVIPTDSAIANRLTDLENLIERYDWIRPSIFGIDGFNTIIRYGGTAEAQTAKYKEIQYFLEDVRRVLKKYPQYIKPDPLPVPNQDELFVKLSNIVYQKFATHFNVPIEVITTVFPDLYTSTGDPDGFIYDLLSALFVQSDIDLWFLNVLDDGTNVLEVRFLYIVMLYIDRVFNLSATLNLTVNEFKYIYLPDTAPNFNNICSAFVETGGIPGYGDTWIRLEPIGALDQWIRFKRKYNLVDVDLIKLWDEVIANGKYQFMEVLKSNTPWGSLTGDLLGDAFTPTPAGLLNTAFILDFHLPEMNGGAAVLRKIDSIYAWVQQIGLRATPIRKGLLAKTYLTMNDADVIMGSVKSKFIDEVWYKVAKPLRNELRTKQRKALADYMLTCAEPGYGKKWRNENELYAYFLIDVEMEACNITSRIRQAISSVQLFIDRVLLGIETQYVSPSYSPKITMRTQYATQWESWRKWYRVWEANRKVFLYPENWIEPDLRDDKSYLFTELESELNGGEVTADRLEDVMRNYIVKLHDIADLEPISSHFENNPDTGKRILHAISRTKARPSKYYYRRLEDNEWTPWEKLELEIDSEHVIPMVLNGRLLLYWLTFRETQYPGDKDTIDKIFSPAMSACPFFFNDRYKASKASAGIPMNDTRYTFKQMEITANWSEYKNRQWQEHNVSPHKLYITINPRLEDHMNWHSKVSPDKDAFNSYYKPLTQDGELNIFDMLKSRLYAYSHWFQSEGTMHIQLWAPTDFLDFKGENAHFIAGFTCDPIMSAPRPWESGTNWNGPAPKDTYFHNQHFWQRPGSTRFYIDAPYARYRAKNYSYMWEENTTRESAFRAASDVILNNTANTGKFKIAISTAYFSMEGIVDYNPVTDKFFFEDNKNTFYVSKKAVGYGPLVALGGSSVTFLSASSSTSLIYSKYAVASSGYPIPVSSSTGPLIGISGSTAVATAVSTKGPYVFETYFHSRTGDFLKKLAIGGIPALMDISTQVPASGDTMSFYGNYSPTSLVNSAYPNNTVDFNYGAAYAVYNWELFFHAPMMIAQKLKDNQQFADARKWYHYIFDPTSNTDASGYASGSKQRFWKFRPFYDAAGAPLSDISDLLSDISKGLGTAVSQVEKWENNPFKPHVIARMRIIAYMKNVVMKYIDNLIAWGDQLFQRDTIESINEATQLYILASNILGTKPQEVPKRAYSAPYSYSELLATGTIDAFSNAKVKIEGYIDNYLRPSGTGGYYVYQQNQQVWVSEQAPKMFYFCLSVNDKLLGYWDTIADRLFKIRNCMNLTGQVRQLPLFEPPIDPALLVKAAAAGIDTNSLLDEISGANLPLYKFQFIVQKANEVCGDVKALGSALLSALEKKDAEALALIRSAQEINVMESIKELKKIQLEEAKSAIEPLQKSKELAQFRAQFYLSRKLTNPFEAMQFPVLSMIQMQQMRSGIYSLIGSVLSVIPELNLQVPFSIGPSFGGRELGAMMQAISTYHGTNAMMNQTGNQMIGLIGSYMTRYEDWQFQGNLANKEIEQIDKQIATAQIRVAIMEKEISNQDLLIQNAKETDAFMKSKYTSIELYNWMISQISTTYFQAYQVAYELAKRAEKTFTKELAFANIPGNGFIRFGYWDSLKKGLLSAEKLQLDIRRMEVSYMEYNKRELELTKHISVALLDPQKIIDLRELGSCSITIPAWMFEMDYPGHYFRRIRTVSISIPCVAGPYTTIACQLSLSSSTGNTVTGADGLPVSVMGSTMRSIATSGAQNDSGMFELNFRDERYLPFEGCGIEDTLWTISLMDKKALRQFDYNTISDVILHFKYTAQDGRSGANLVKEALEERLMGAGDILLPRYFTYAHEFSQEFFAGFSELVPYGTNPANPAVAREFILPLSHAHFPYYCEGRTITIDKVYFYLRPKEEGHTYAIEIDGTAAQVMTGSPVPDASYVGVYTVSSDITPDGELDLPFKLYLFDSATPAILNREDLRDIYIICQYKLV